jgi:hypothetical protein
MHLGVEELRPEQLAPTARDHVLEMVILDFGDAKRADPTTDLPAGPLADDLTGREDVDVLLRHFVDELFLDARTMFLESGRICVDKTVFIENFEILWTR